MPKHLDCEAGIHDGELRWNEYRLRNEWQCCGRVSLNGAVTATPSSAPATSPASEKSDQEKQTAYALSSEKSEASVVTYASGATRSTENTYDPEGFLNPDALRIYCEYMQKHRVQKDGTLRDGDNWQKGFDDIPRVFRSLARHYFDVWLIRRGYPPKSSDCTGLTDALCAVIFNCMVLLKQGVK